MKYELLSAFPGTGKTEGLSDRPSIAQWWDVAGSGFIPEHSRSPAQHRMTPSLSRPLKKLGSWKNAADVGEKAAQEIFTLLTGFSQIPIKRNPTTRNNLSLGPTPQMLPEWTLRFPHHKIICFRRPSLASGIQPWNPPGALRMVLMTLPSGSSCLGLCQECTSKDYSTRRVLRMWWD